jgi:PBP1b-binding outer membrane lipoprotein LpoB
MPRKLVLLMMALVALAMFAVACGDEDEPANDAAPAAEQTAEGASGEDVPDNAKEAVEQCKQSFQSQPQLSDDVKADLEEICEKAASGDEAAVRDATREVCEKIIEDTIPEDNPAREQALETCKTAAP